MGSPELARNLAELSSDIRREVGVLIEKIGRMPGQMVGKSDHLHAVHVSDSHAEVGELIRVRITGSATNSLAATRL